MKLSEAMMLGSTTCKMVANDWNSCALGSAANAIGIPMATKRGEGTYQICPDGNLRLGHIKDAWPWLNDSGLLEAIWKRFDNQVVCGGMTLEALVDYVRSIEPDCGGCNRFDCTCKRAGAESTASEQVSVTA